MEGDIFSEIVAPEDLKKFEKVYHQQLYDNNVTDTAQFEYAWCLVRSKYPTDVKKGIVLLQELCNKNKNGQRDYIYYLAIGNARIKEYSKALKYCRTFLEIEPGNQQMLSLETNIKKKMDKEGLLGMLYTGGALVATGAVIGTIIAITKSK